MRFRLPLITLLTGLVLVAASSAHAAAGWRDCEPRTYVADGKRFASSSPTPVLLLAGVEVRRGSCSTAHTALDRLAAAVPRDGDNAPRAGHRTVRLTSRSVARLSVRDHEPGEAPRGTVRIEAEGHTAVRARLAS